MEEKIKEYFNKLDLDIRKKPQGYSRFMDQKVTPDVLTFIADCVVNFLGGKPINTNFTNADIWGFPYFVKNTIAVFGKPSPENESANSEYDKFIAQPLKTLAFSQVLKEEKIGTRNTYTVFKPEILEYIALNERYSLIFLVIYLEKVLTDSGLIKEFTSYKEKAEAGKIDSESLSELKTKFQAFMRGYTEINGDTEINRIFPKILNPFSAHYQIPGIEKGQITDRKFVYADLMYNRENFRDLGKGKDLTRQEALKEVSEKPEVFGYRVQKAKNLITRHYTNSELKDSLSMGQATQVHHMFPAHVFPEIADYVENLILLTPQQHYTRAHPENNTHLVDPDYQKECLLAKLDSINTSIGMGETLYSKEKFIHVLNVGYSLELPTTQDFEQLKKIVLEK